MIRFLFGFGCRHREQSRPMHDYQRCLDCGARRSYQIGGPFGPWEGAELPAPWMDRSDLQEEMLRIQKAARVIVLPRRQGR